MEYTDKVSLNQKLLDEDDKSSAILNFLKNKKSTPSFKCDEDNNRNIEDINQNNKENYQENKNKNISPKSGFKEGPKEKKSKVSSTNVVPYREYSKIKIILQNISIPSNDLRMMIANNLIELISLIFLCQSDNTLIQINSYQISLILISTLGYDFIIGSFGAFEFLSKLTVVDKDYITLYKLYNEAKIYSFLVFLLVTLPFCFSGDYLLYFLGIDETTSNICGEIIKISMIGIFLTIFNRINHRLLNLIGYSSYVLSINIFCFVIYVIGLMTSINSFNLGAKGVAISFVSINFLDCIITHYFVFKFNPFKEIGSIFWFDTSCLQSSKFYIYAKHSTSIAFFNTVSNFIPNFIVLGSYYVNDLEGSKISITASIILLNYIRLVNSVIKGLSSNISESIRTYLKHISVTEIKKSYQNMSFLKRIINGRLDDPSIINMRCLIFIIYTFTLLFSVLNYLFSWYIFYIYFGSNNYFKVVYEKFYRVLNFYSFFIFIDANINMLNSFLKGLHHHHTINLLNSLLLLTIFLPLGILMTFTYNFSFLGFWYSNYFAAGLMTNSIFLYYLTRLDFIKEVVRFKKFFSRRKELD